MLENPRIFPTSEDYVSRSIAPITPRGPASHKHTASSLIPCTKIFGNPYNMRCNDKRFVT